ncbi:hypothetical protein ENBRE01_1139 [Enteropsectra breve]|nr:hypothetical protein ENBRE01_1139 [Enteropsectra breve]
MIVVHILIQCLWAAENEMQKKTRDDRLFEDIKLNREEIRYAMNNGLLAVYLPWPMPTGKQMYNVNELKEFLNLEKKENCKNKKHDYNEDVATRCAVCFDSFFDSKNFENSFKERVFETHNQLPKCVMCPNPRCSDGRICCNCVRALIKDGTKPDPYKAPIKYFDNKNRRISNQKMVLCPLCRIYLNVELSELDQIPESANLSACEKLNHIEDLVYSTDKRFWLLETTKTLESKSYTRLFTTMHELKTANFTRDASQVLLSNDLFTQYDFYTACIQNNRLFTDRVTDIKRFIQNCTEKIDYPFIYYLQHLIASSSMSLADLEARFKDICSAVPIEHADKFTMLYHSMITGYFKKSKDCRKNCQFIIRWILSKYSFILTGFQHCDELNYEENKYYPSRVIFTLHLLMHCMTRG